MEKLNKVAVVVGSMNCMPTEYALLLAEKGWNVTHYYDAKDNDLLSNPLIKLNGISINSTLKIRKQKFPHPIAYLFSRGLHKTLIDELDRADFVILSGTAISLARLLKRKIDKNVIAIGYGDDISVFCNLDWPFKRFNERNHFVKILYGWSLFKLHNRLVKIQRSGVVSSTHLSYFPVGFDRKTDRILDELLLSADTVRLDRYSISTRNLPRLYEPQFVDREEDLKVMFPVRFSSSSDTFLDKGWKIFLEGVAAYIRLRPARGVVFICFNKGDCLQDAKDMAGSLKVDKFIKWLDVVPFQELYPLMNNADVIVDQLGEQWLGVGMWGALLGKPVISNLSNPSIQGKFKGPYFLHAMNAAQFAAQLVTCESEEFRLKARSVNREFAKNSLSLEAEFELWQVV
jgi:hypothetical protein